MKSILTTNVMGETFLVFLNIKKYEIKKTAAAVFFMIKIEGFFCEL